MIKKKTKCLSKKEKLFKKLGLRRSYTGINQSTIKEKKKTSSQTANFADSLEEFLPGYNWVENKITGKDSMPRKLTPDSTQHQQCSSTELFDDKNSVNSPTKRKKINQSEMKESNIEEKNLNNMHNEQETAINLSGTEGVKSEVHSTEDGNQLRMNILGKRKSPFSQNVDEVSYQKFERMHSPQTTIGNKIGNIEDQSASTDINNDVICLSDRDKGGAADLDRFDTTRGSKEFQHFNSKYMNLRQKEETLVLEITERKGIVKKKRMELIIAEEKLKDSLTELNKVEASRRQMEVKHEERMAKLKSLAAEDILKKNNAEHTSSSSNNLRSSPIHRTSTPTTITLQAALPPPLPPSIPTTAQQQIAEAMTGLANIQQKLTNQEIVVKERQVQEAVKAAEGRRMQSFGVPAMQQMIPNRFMQPNMNPMNVMGQQQWRPTVACRQIPRKMLKNGMQMPPFHLPNQAPPVSIPQASIPANFRPGQPTINQVATVSPQPSHPSLPPSPQMKSPKPKEAEEEKKKPSCDRCLKEANYLCSNCKKIWYCSSTCQYSSWEVHSRSCLKAN